MQTNDPHLTKTPINPADNSADGSPQSKVIDTDTQINESGAEILKADVVDSEHVNSGDNSARQPDRRDQQGNAFDEGVNEDTIPRYGHDEPKSEEITDQNRYATIDNGQKRVLNTTDQNQ